uniref:Uncharacterized protein n=1 Tax=Moniliophthora roreri TaxID=221103 RepID=A0A0W0FHM6_MONRR
MSEPFSSAINPFHANSYSPGASDPTLNNIFDSEWDDLDWDSLREFEEVDPDYIPLEDETDTEPESEGESVEMETVDADRLADRVSEGEETGDGDMAYRSQQQKIDSPFHHRTRMLRERLEGQGPIDWRVVAVLDKLEEMGMDLAIIKAYLFPLQSLQRRDNDPNVGSVFR